MRVSREEFENLVSKALADLPKRFKDRLENIALVVEDAPSPEIIRELGLRSSLNLLGLYQGVPLKHRGIHYGNVLPDRIVIYQRATEAGIRTPEELILRIRRTVMHEVGHFFGLAESELRGLEGDE
jgi:predicted Zn-dependent protease with MMP-like domain